MASLVFEQAEFVEYPTFVHYLYFLLALLKMAVGRVVDVVDCWHCLNTGHHSAQISHVHRDAGQKHCLAMVLPKTGSGIADYVLLRVSISETRRTSTHTNLSNWCKVSLGHTTNKSKILVSIVNVV